MIFVLVMKIRVLWRIFSSRIQKLIETADGSIKVEFENIKKFWKMKNLNIELIRFY